MDLTVNEYFNVPSRNTCKVVKFPGTGARIYPKGCQVCTFIGESEVKKFTDKGQIKKKDKGDRQSVLYARRGTPKSASKYLNLVTPRPGRNATAARTGSNLVLEF